MAEEPMTPQPPPPPPPPVAPPPAPPAGGSTAPEGGLKILLYIVSFLIPLAGIIIGIIFFTKNTPEEKKFGKMCIILAVVSIVVMCLCVCAFYGITIGLSILGSSANM
jgi:hypothetical protein